MTHRSINPRYSARGRQRPAHEPLAEPPPASVEKVVTGNATLYRADCFDVLPGFSGVAGAVGAISTRSATAPRSMTDRLP